MIKVLHDKETGVLIKKEYPRKDNKPVIGLDPKYEWLDLIIEPKPEHNHMQYACISKLEIVESVVVESYYLQEKPQNVVLINLNKSLGEYLSTEYPEWQRIKHHVEANSMRWDIGLDNFTESDLIRYNYIQSLNTWINECRTLRDEYEQIYINDGQLPSVVWPTKPIDND